MIKYILFLLLIIPVSALSQFNFNENCREAYVAIISLDFDKGKELINNEKSRNPDNLIPLYLDNYIDFLTLIIGENENEFDNRRSNVSHRINLLEEGNKNSPYYNYCLANTYLQWAFVRIKFKEYIKAFFEIRRAYLLLEENKEKFPGFIPNNIGLGILHTIIGTIPDEYKWFTNIIGMKGSVNQGNNELMLVMDSAKANDKYNYLLPECAFYLTFINLNISSDESKSLELKSYLDSLEMENPLLTFARVSILLRTGNNDKAIELLTSRKEYKNKYPLYHLDYLTGLAKLNRLDDDAYKYFFNYLMYFKGRNYKAAACQKLAWYYLIHGDTGKYKEYLARSLSYDEGIVDEDKQAHLEAEKNRLQNIQLLKARLLFDGGYYEKALDVLFNKASKNSLRDDIDSVEYNYRFGRIYDEIDKDTLALKYYEITINTGNNLDEYYAGNAALLSGRIYEKQSALDNAQKYYNICLDLDFKEYRKSIKYKAKGGLSRVTDQ